MLRPSLTIKIYWFSTTVRIADSRCQWAIGGSTPARANITIDVANNLATEVWNYPQDEIVFSPFCGSVYEDAPLNYLIDYALVNGAGLPNTFAQLLGLDAAGDKVFYYQYFSWSLRHRVQLPSASLGIDGFPDGRSQAT